MNLPPLKVLLIDDDEDDFVNIRALLNEIPNAEYKLIWMSSYQEGLNALSNDRYDACLLDYRLGEMTGLDLLRRAHHLGLTCPTILLTGHGDFDLDIQAMQTGAADYLVKTQITAPLLERSIRYSMKRAIDMQELSEQKENFRILFNSTFEGIIVHTHGHIVDANSAAGEIFGFSSHEMIETSLCEHVRPEYRQVLEEQLKSDAVVRTEAIGLKKDGTEIYIGISSRVVSLKGESVSLVAVRDLTQSKLLEAQILQQDRLASLGLLASSLAHEIGTPLGVIRGRAELVAKTTDEKLRGTMDIIITQIDRVAKLVNSLLQLARGQHSSSVTDVNLSSVIQDVLNLMSHELDRKNIELRTLIKDGTEVRAEPGPLGQVVLNLLVNSVHAIEEARNRDRRDHHLITVQAREIENNKVELSIEDTGCGVPEKNLGQLFKPFFTTKDVGLGTGLGLATSYKLIQSWGGSIRVHSKEGSGTVFTVTLFQSPGTRSTDAG